MGRAMCGVMVMVMGLLLGTDANGQQSLADAARMRPSAVPADDAVATPAASLEDALHAAFTQADIVFTGTVAKVERTDAAVLVHFAVDDAIRGVAGGGEYILREWPGLWIDDADRYTEGERRLMLLHAASSAGYASPVAGSRGSIRMHGVAADLRLLATDVSPANQTAMAQLSSRMAPQAMTLGIAENGDVKNNGIVDGKVIADLLHAWAQGGGR